MLIWVKDCVLYRSNMNITTQQLESNLTPGSFDKYRFTIITNQITEIEYTWLDSIKIRDKIITKKPKTLKAWFFTKSSNIIFFGNSESDINFLKTKLESSLGNSLTKLDIFSTWKNKYNNNINWFAKLISVHIKNEIIPYDEDLIKKLPVDVLGPENIKTYLNNKLDLIANLTFLYNKTYYYMDINSVISFPDTIEIDEIVLVLNEVLSEF
ncbi:hypothetical protein [Bacillus suaedae]|uniref:Uncharacterized protein n=1 Tax=Halalkalibacter suaedae TaxID=2822140 RepID=A0A941AP67_9BACI|nr:hypothetical protein [Bacillus suaedae]MBP3951162.1 hypothetical protein [Bacillus suaedae]